LTRPRVALCGVFHESNTFITRPTSLSDFDISSVKGDAMLRTFDGTQTVVGGFIAGGRSLDFDLIPTVHRWATPAGKVARDAFDHIEEEVSDSLRSAAQLDGVLLELHGAMTVEGVPAADGTVAASIRRAVGVGVPIVAVIDPHANFSQSLLEHVDVVIAYHRRFCCRLRARHE
jgi:microcystin degradation protein MlrC